jgi:hypothetical protein
MNLESQPPTIEALDRGVCGLKKLVFCRFNWRIMDVVI